MSATQWVEDLVRLAMQAVDEGLKPVAGELPRDRIKRHMRERMAQAATEIASIEAELDEFKRVLEVDCVADLLADAPDDSPPPDYCECETPGPSFLRGDNSEPLRPCCSKCRGAIHDEADPLAHIDPNLEQALANMRAKRDGEKK